jgi:hypothetical protein
VDVTDPVGYWHDVCVNWTENASPVGDKRQYENRREPTLKLTEAVHGGGNET